MAVLSTALTTLANAKIIAGISDSTYDPTLTLLINSASGIITRYLNRNLGRGTYTEVKTGNNRQLLVMDQWPIQSITSVTVDARALTLNSDYRMDTNDAASGILYKEDGWHTGEVVVGLTQDPVACVRGISVVYVAGYYLPADVGYVEGASNSLPLEIQQVCNEMVAAMFTRIRFNAYGLSSYAEGGISMTWQRLKATTVMGISDEHALVLNAYRRGVIA